jgi:hypothetical protein
MSNQCGCTLRDPVCRDGQKLYKRILKIASAIERLHWSSEKHQKLLAEWYEITAAYEAHVR